MSITNEELRMLGASDAPALFGRGGLMALYHRVTTGERSQSTPEMADGTDAENFTRRRYERHTGWRTTGEQKWRHPLVPWMRSSPDATVNTDAGLAGAEWKYWRSFPSEVGGVPTGVWLQVQVVMGLSLEVLGEWTEPWVDVVNGYGALDVRRVPYQEGVLERFVGLGDRFMADFVAQGEVPGGPNLVLLEQDAAAISALFPREDTEGLRGWSDLTENDQCAVVQWLEANARRREWKKREEGLAMRVKLAVRGAGGVELPSHVNGQRIDFRAQRGAPAFDRAGLLAALEHEDPVVATRVRELLKQFTQETTTRPLVAR